MASGFAFVAREADKRVCWRFIRLLLVLVSMNFVRFRYNLRGYYVKCVENSRRRDYVGRCLLDHVTQVKKKKKNRFRPEPKHERFSVIPPRVYPASILCLLHHRLKRVKGIISTETTTLAWRPLWVDSVSEKHWARRGRVNSAYFSVC